MYKKLLLLVILSVNIIFTGCEIDKNYIPMNILNFNVFTYKGNKYELKNMPPNYIYYGTKHFIGYTRGSYFPFCSTYVLDSDIEENILFQNKMYFWTKNGQELVSKNTKISSIIINIRCENFNSDHIEFFEYDYLIEIDKANFSEVFILENNLIDGKKLFSISLLYENNIIYNFDYAIIDNDGNVYCKTVSEDCWYKISDEYGKIIRSEMLN